MLQIEQLLHIFLQQQQMEFTLLQTNFQMYL